MSYNLPFLNKNHIYNNIQELYLFIKEEVNSDIHDYDNFKEKYFNSINEIQHTKVPFDLKEIIIDFDNRYLIDNLLTLDMIEKKDLLDDKHLFRNEERNEIEKKMKEALELLNKLHPSLYELINLLVGTFIFIKKEGFGGGSVSNTIGLIWLNPQKDWTVYDYAESIYHEFIHQSIFLDDMVNCIFPDPSACEKEEAQVKSTILEIKRPLDRSFHAAGVAIGIMHMYYLLGEKEKSMQYIDNLKITINEINERTQFLGEQGLIILEQFNNFIENIEYNSITSSLNKGVS